MIAKPQREAAPPYYWTYIDLIAGEDLVAALSSNIAEALAVGRSISPEMEEYRYAPGKWSIKQVYSHLTDTERVMAYRALCFSRGDTSELPGFSEDDYAAAAHTEARTLADILNELHLVRQSTIALYQSMNDKMLDTKGIANKISTNPRAIGYMIAGHQLHHINILKERYLPNNRL